MDSLSEKYLNFKRDLRSHPKSLYYDEDDLVDIFDYAGDINDQHIRLEALLLGYRLFPDSVELLKRRAIFLADADIVSFSRMMSTYDNIVYNDLIWELMQCKAYGSPSTIIDRLDTLLNGYSLNTDEEIIQFVGVAHQYGCDKWLTDNIDRIKAKCRCPNTLIYEIARAAETKQQISAGIQLLETLTFDEPFNVDYWCLLAEMQATAKQFDNALTSLEYVKAVQPDNIDTNALEGYIYLQLNRADKAVAPLEHYYTSHPDNDENRRNLILAYRQTGERDKMGEPVKRSFDITPDDEDLFVDMLILFPDEVDSTIKRFHAVSSADDEQSAEERFSELCTRGNSSIALKYLAWYTEEYGPGQSLGLAILDMYYGSDYYKKAYDFLNENFDELNLDPVHLPYLGLIASILIRNHDYESTLLFIDNWIERLENIGNQHYINRVIATGVKDILMRMKTTISGTDSLPLSDEIIQQITV